MGWKDLLKDAGSSMLKEAKEKCNQLNELSHEVTDLKERYSGYPDAELADMVVSAHRRGDRMNPAALAAHRVLTDRHGSDGVREILRSRMS
jgi:hypothetical protein